LELAPEQAWGLARVRARARELARELA
jgi:hypothetical protein